MPAPSTLPSLPAVALAAALWALAGCGISVPDPMACDRQLARCAAPTGDLGFADDVPVDAGGADAARDASRDVAADTPDVPRVCNVPCDPPRRCIAGTCVAPPVSCEALRALDPSLPSGTYAVAPRGAPGSLDVHCEFSATAAPRSFLLGGQRANGAVEILGGCPAGSVPFPVRSLDDARALSAWLHQRPGAALYWANAFAGPTRTDDNPAVCPSFDTRVGWLSSPEDWVTANIAPGGISTLDLSRHCNRAASWAPIPWSSERGATNPDGAPGRLQVVAEATLLAQVVCTVDAIGCPPLRAECDGDLVDRCEADLLSNAAHCGGCGLRCPPAGRLNNTGACVGGRCGCDEGWADCDTRRSNGCETDLTTSAQHCGQCGRRCDGTCSEGRCTP